MGKLFEFFKISAKTPGAILQPQPPPWENEVNFIGVVILKVIGESSNILVTNQDLFSKYSHLFSFNKVSGENDLRAAKKKRLHSVAFDSDVYQSDDYRSPNERRPSEERLPL